MNGYFLLQCASTLAALLLLAAVGGWSLWVFRSKERPYLWLATPLAGLGVLALSLTVLFRGCRLNLPWAFALSLAVNVPITLMAVWRGGLPRRRPRDWALAVVVLFGVLAVGVRLVQDASIRQYEPTVVVVGGSDQFGYSHVGDWIVHHPHQVPQPSPERPYESWLEIASGEARHGAYLLVALAGWCRGTTTLFSFDWGIGVALIAGLLGFAAAFARRPLPLLLLLVAAAVSLWFRNSRTGYFGKTLTYPGYLLLTYQFIQTWRRTTWPRVLCLTGLATGFGLCLSPVSLLALFGILGMGAVGARLVALTLALARRERWRAADPGPLWKGGALSVVCLAPLCLIASESLRGCLKPFEWGTQVKIEFVVAEALDVSANWEPCDGPGKSRPTLVKAALVAVAVGFLWAAAFRATLAAGLFLCSGIAAAALLPGRAWSVYQMQGLLYPLSLAGALLLWQHQAVWRSSRHRAVALILVLAMAAARVPQLKGTLEQTTQLKPGVPGFIARSHITAIVDRVGKGPVDLCQREVCVCLAALVELGVRDIPVQYRHPAWQLTVGYRGWPVPHYDKPSRYLLTGWNDNRSLPIGALANPLWALLPSEGVWIGEVKLPLGLGREAHHGYNFWLAGERAEIELSNGTATHRDIDFVAYTEIWAITPDPGKRTLLWGVGEQSGKLELTLSNREIHIPVHLPPGDHKLSLRVEQPSPCGGEEKRLLISRFGLCPGLGGLERSEAP
jgi:hypothetical protein